jgi:hypothetical protein
MTTISTARRQAGNGARRHGIRIGWLGQFDVHNSSLRLLVTPCSPHAEKLRPRQPYEGRLRVAVAMEMLFLRLIPP